MIRTTRTAQMATNLLLLLTAGPVLAINMIAIGDMPIRYMTDEDRVLMSEAARATLDQGAEGKTTTWENPKTGARGELTPLVTYDQAGRKCRDMEVANSAKGRSNRLVLSFCRQDVGSWKIDGR